MTRSLEEFLAGERGGGLYRGGIRSNKEAFAAFAADQDMEAVVESWIDKRKFSKLLDVWVKGLPVDWERLCRNSRRRRVSLPTYPFASEAYWVWPYDLVPARTMAGSLHAREMIGSAVLHPLIHRNTSDLSVLRFTSTFTGEEFFLKDHVVDGRRILPGAAYLEMARAAIVQACGFESKPEELSVEFKDVAWLRPVTVTDEPVVVHVAVEIDDAGVLVFTIYRTEPETAGDTRDACVQGRAFVTKGSALDGLDIEKLRSKFQGRALSSADLYENFRSLGVEYGTAYQTVHAVYCGAKQVLAHLRLPESLASTAGEFVVHPCLLDGALQASLGLLLDPQSKQDRQAKAAMLFIAGSVVVEQACGVAAWAWLRRSADSTDASPKLDLDVCNERGQVCIQMRGLVSRSPAASLEATASNALGLAPREDVDDQWLLAPVWEPMQVAVSPQWPSRDQRVLIVAEPGWLQSVLHSEYPHAQVMPELLSLSSAEIAARLEPLGEFDHVFWAALIGGYEDIGSKNHVDRQEQGVLAYFRLHKALLRLGAGDRDLGLTIITVNSQPVHREETIDPAHAGVHGLIGSMAKEHHRWSVRLIDLEPGGSASIKEVLSIAPDPGGNAWAYRDGDWYRQSLLRAEPASGSSRLRKDGTYLVIGGAGGIGEVLSEYLVRAYDAQLIWMGRSRQNSRIAAQLDRIASFGKRPEYFSADVTDLHALQYAWDRIRTAYGRIDGVICSVVGDFDKSLAKMDEEHFSKVIATKIDGSIRLAQVLAEAELDFVLFFSSINSFGKEFGKSGYCAGCTFSDALAYQWALERRYPVKVMNWGYWGEVGSGAAIPQSAKNRVSQMGIGSIEPSDGMEALERLLRGPFCQLAYFRSTRAHSDLRNSDELTAAQDTLPSIIQSFRDFQPPALPREIADAAAVGAGELMKGFDALLLRLLTAQLKSLGLFAEPRLEISSWKHRAGIPAIYDGWLQETLRVLASAGYLTLEREFYVPSELAYGSGHNAWTEWEEQKRSALEGSELRAQATLVEATLRALPEILTAKRPATEVMFPRSSMDLVEGIYKNSRITDYFNQVLGATLVRYLEERLRFNPAARVRIVEIGAGTGATSAALIRLLAPFGDAIDEYCYTDISKAFLLHAEKEYGRQAPYLTTRLLNVEEPLEEQSFPAASFDVTIATNVMHATRNIRISVRNAKACLKQNGLLILNEMSSNFLFAHLTFGLLEGWWRHEDSDLRMQGCPGLAPATWKRVLRSEGFRSVFFPVEAAHRLGQQVVVAESDGVIRQQHSQTLSLAAEAKPRPKTAPTAVSASPVIIKETSVAVSEGFLRQRTTAYLKQVLSQTLKIPLQQIDTAEAFEAYGLDSILVVQLTDALRSTLPGVGSTTFFEHQTIDQLVEHLLRTDRAAVCKLAGVGETQASEALASDGLQVSNLIIRVPAMIRVPAARNRRIAGLAFASREEQKPTISGQPNQTREIAIIGIAGRYPQARTLAQFWENLKSGRDCLSEVPPERWCMDAFYHPDPEEAIAQGKSYGKRGGFIDGFAEFDPLFFNISPREALEMDPQERLFLQACWDVLEDAGYTRERIAKRHQSRVGVFAGITKTGYILYAPELSKLPEPISPHTSFSSVANRVSYLLNLQGPSLPVDTMCSASLTAVHEACEHLLRGECELAIAGGVNVYVHPSGLIGLAARRMLSAKGECRSFGAGADG